MTNDQHESAVNPNYEKSVDYKVNCAYCTAAYELRKRGYDVEAQGNGTLRMLFDPNDIEEIESWYDAAETIHQKDIYSDALMPNDHNNGKTHADALTKELLKHGEGARGQFIVYWEGGGGHSMVWEIENGRVVIRDCQSNSIFSMSKVISRSSEYMYIRTDNVELNPKILKAVKNK